MKKLMPWFVMYLYRNLLKDSNYYFTLINVVMINPPRTVIPNIKSNPAISVFLLSSALSIEIMGGYNI